MGEGYWLFSFASLSRKFHAGASWFGFPRRFCCCIILERCMEVMKYDTYVENDTCSVRQLYITLPYCTYHIVHSIQDASIIRSSSSSSRNTPESASILGSQSLMETRSHGPSGIEYLQMAARH